jgi:hypothetical protein
VKLTCKAVLVLNSRVTWDGVSSGSGGGEGEWESTTLLSIAAGVLRFGRGRSAMIGAELCH